MSSPYYERLGVSPTPIRPSLDIETMERACIGRDYWHADANKIPDKCPHKKMLLNYVENICQLEPKGVGTYIYGPLGAGKTAVAVILLKAAMIRGCSGLFTTSTELQRSLEAKYPVLLPNGATFEEGMRNVNFLVVDDLGGEDDASWKQHLTEMILRARQRDLLPTLITSNISPEAVQSPWLKSFIGHYYIPIQTSGINWRHGVQS